ncbi:hypothetical protein PHMEG_0005176 [Phytophthora megakarya]|uniref:Bzip transcription factor n=1 Tax=Phytophthora megakarya TaxID=4795 RepID=A0A225WTH4_9STRA|nr:hypothetical protein PHMEG_0005176 [Phytophthora megakarya]
MHRIVDILEQCESRHFSHLLSSDVIGRVLPRAKPVSHQVLLKTTEIPETAINSASTDPVSSNPTKHNLSLNVPGECLVDDTSYSIPINDSHDQGDDDHGGYDIGYESTISRQACDHKTSLRNAVVDNRNIDLCSVKTPKPKSKRKLKGTAEYREMRRIHQERYRQKQRRREKDVAITSIKLRQDISLLEMQRTRMIFSPKLTLEAVVAEYFQLFRHGILSQDPDSQTYHAKAKLQRQIVFLRTAIANNVILGANRRGLKNLIDQWQRYSTYFEDVELQLGYVAKVSDEIIWANSTLSVTITDTTMVYVFPHLAKGNKLARLRSRLHGQRLALPYRVCFEWDKDTKRVARLETMVDFLPPLFHVFGSLRDVALVLEKAFITPDSVIDNHENASEP